MPPMCGVSVDTFTVSGRPYLAVGVWFDVHARALNRQMRPRLEMAEEAGHGVGARRKN